MTKTLLVASIPISLPHGKANKQNNFFLSRTNILYKLLFVYSLEIMPLVGIVNCLVFIFAVKMCKCVYQQFTDRF